MHIATPTHITGYLLIGLCCLGLLVFATSQVQWNRNDNDKFSAHADTNHNLFVLP